MTPPPSIDRSLSGEASALLVTALTLFGLLLMLSLAPPPPYVAFKDVARFDRIELCGTASAPDPALSLECRQPRAVDLPFFAPAEGRERHFTVHFRLTATLGQSGALDALFVPQVSDNLAVAINGAWITPAPIRNGQLWHDWAKPIYLPIPKPLLRSGATTFDILVTSERPDGVSLYPMFLGSADDLQLAWLNSFSYRTGAVRINGTVAILLVFAFAIFWHSSPSRSGAGWLPAMMAATAIYSFKWSYPNITPDGAGWKILWLLSSQASVYCFYRFLIGFIEGPPHKTRLPIVHGIMIVSALVAGLGALLPNRDLTPLFHLGTGVIAFLLLADLLGRPIRRTPRLQAVTFILLSLAAACALSGWLQTHAFIMTAAPDYVVLTPALLSVAIAWILLERMVQLRREQARFNASLKEEIAAKTAELEATFSQLSEERQRHAVIEERQRIMMDLHDGVGGQLVNALAYLDNSRANDPVLYNAIEDALRDMALMVDSLNGADDVLSMLGVLRNRIEPLLERHHVRFEWKVDIEPDMVAKTPARLVSLMRIVQEAITNAVKHSRADIIAVETDTKAITVKDDGRGFDPEAPRQGLGISGMYRRAQELDMALDIDGDRDGSIVRISIP